jgi:hypothetical protein
MPARASRCAEAEKLEILVVEYAARANHLEERTSEQGMLGGGISEEIHVVRRHVHEQAAAVGMREPAPLGKEPHHRRQMENRDDAGAVRLLPPAEIAGADGAARGNHAGVH